MGEGPGVGEGEECTCSASLWYSGSTRPVLTFGDVDVPIEKQVLAFLVAALKPCTEMS